MTPFQEIAKIGRLRVRETPQILFDNIETNIVNT